MSAHARTVAYASSTAMLGVAVIAAYRYSVTTRVLAEKLRPQRRTISPR
jgi:hypothetical protein